MYKLVVVEDEHLIRNYVAHGIDYRGMNIVVVGEAEDGEQGAALIRALKPDIVISDINMPKLTGFEMFELTQDIDYKKIILSGYDDFANAKKAMRYGVMDFISKPIDENDLRESIYRACLDIPNRPDIFEEFPHLEIQYNKSTDLVISDVIQFIHQHYHEPISIPTIANQFGISESNLYKKIKDELGITLTDYINRFRVKQAMILLLKDSNLRVYEIANEVGFTDYNYFSKVFRKYTHYTISEFKEKITQN